MNPDVPSARSLTLVSTPDLTTQPPPPPAAVAPRRPTATYRTNMVTILLGAWFTLGLFLDAWAHSNLTELESFFTPWHAVFYSGFVATAGWITWTVHGAWRAGRAGIQSIPLGYAAAAVAVVGFAVAAVGDFLWHTIFGIEQNIDILFSPTHLGLITAMLVIVATPLRAMWVDRSVPVAPGLRRLLPAVLSTALATTLVLLFLQYANALTFDGPAVVGALSGADEGFAADLVSAMAVTNLVLILPLLMLARRWVLPFGTVTMLYAAVGALASAITAFENLDLIIGLLAAGVCVDLLARWLRPTPQRLTRWRVFAALAPLATWTIFIATAYVTAPALAPPDVTSGHPEAVLELTTGAPIVQALVGLLASFMLVPGGPPLRAAPGPTGGWHAPD
jgi:hypothetical protein